MTLSVERLQQLANALDTSPYLLLGAPNHPQIEMLGTLDGQGNTLATDASPLLHQSMSIWVDASDPVGVDLSASIGRYDAGDVLVGDRTYQLSEMPDHYCDCLVGLPSGGHVLRRIEDRHGDLFTLAEMWPGGKIDRDSRILWIAPVAMRLTHLQGGGRLDGV